MTRYRGRWMLVFSFDPGTSSTGWAAIRIVPANKPDPSPKLLGLGTYLFGVGCSERTRKPQSLSDRHRLRRCKRSRCRKLIGLLTEAGLLPENIGARTALFVRDPYEIRARGLHERLDLHEFGRAICHISKRRGKVDVGHSPKTILEPNGFPTWGAWLWSRRNGSMQKCLPVRNRLYEVGDIESDLAPPRAALEHELNMLWKVQHSFQPAALSMRQYKRIRSALFDQPQSRARGLAGSGEHFGQDSPRDPLVRVACGQIGKVLKTLIARFGQPDLIVVEKFGLNRMNAPRANRLVRTRRPAIGRFRAARNRLQLLKHQQIAAGGQAFCPYTGTQLDRALVLSSKVEIDHIHPASRGGGAIDNLVLCLASANRVKADRTPYEAFGGSHHWHEILLRTRRLPKGCRERMLARVPDL